MSFYSRTITQKLVSHYRDSTPRLVEPIDLRNHGDTGIHSSEMTYAAMANDVSQHILNRGWNQVNVMGHSMGGKVAMTMALDPAHSSSLQSLIVVDIAPVSLVGGASEQLFDRYLTCMKHINQSHVTSLQQADALLKPVIPDAGVRAFVMTNLKKQDASPFFTFRVNVDSIHQHLRQIMDFPLSSYKPFLRPCLFIYGSKANYVTEEHRPLIRKLFPQAEFVGIDAGHWQVDILMNLSIRVHAEKPSEFVSAVIDFYQKNNL